MDFFRAQDAARRNTTRLVILFTLAVLSLIVITNLLVMVLFGFLARREEAMTLGVMAAQFNWQVFVAIGALITLVIFCGSTYKTMALSGGGRTVAQSLGGRLLSQNTIDLHERKALNVVEEMAIASGMPVPPVYLLEREQGINAFAAGFTRSDAVIGLTRGAITHLSREELQGVIAHEFSHILNGDMRLNIRLIGILHGILLIGLIGHYILRSTRGGSRKNAGPILGLGIGLLIIGYGGTFFGNLIKSSVSRQREFLADASAVQFTRSNQGIAGALKKIGAYAFGSELASPQAPSMSHAYFSSGVSSALQSIFATHPPLKVRIKRIDPRWDGIFVPLLADGGEEATETRQATAPASHTEAMKTAVLGASVASQILNSAGQSSMAHLDYSVDLVNNIPDAIYAAAHEPYGARAIMYCLLLGKQPDILGKQLQQLKAFDETGIFELVSELHAHVTLLDIRFRLPLVDMALPLLRELSASQYELFKRNLLFLIQADNQLGLFEWSLQKILFRHLDPEFGRAWKKLEKFASLNAVKTDIDVLMSMLAHNCVGDAVAIETALATAAKELDFNNLVLLSPDQINTKNLNAAVDNLALLKPLIKPRLLKACLAVITQDKNYSATEMELMRAIADVLDCPLPPYLG